jgi:predicted DNA-binding WGR domain protein
MVIEQEIYLENTQGNHNKFYIMSYSFIPQAKKVTLIIQWGKIGYKGSKRTIHFDSVKKANNFMHNQIRSKLAKGYELKPEYFHKRKKETLDKRVAAKIATDAEISLARFSYIYWSKNGP